MIASIMNYVAPYYSYLLTEYDMKIRFCEQFSRVNVFLRSSLEGNYLHQSIIIETFRFREIVR